MKQKFLIIFAAASVAALLYCLSLYIYLDINLVPELGEPTALMETLVIFIIPAMVITGLFYITLLVRKLKTLNGRFFDGLFTVMIILSGITLLSDLTLLTDIGKEYLLFDVSSEWMMLYGLTAVQLITAIIGLIMFVETKTEAEKLFRISGQRQENVFLSMHQIALVCGIAGMAGIALSMTGWIIPMRFSVMLMGVVSALVVCPLALIVLYWLISMKKSRAGEWTDEKQRADTGAAAITALVVFLAVMVAGLVVGGMPQIKLPVSFWLLSEFFLMLTGFAGVIVAKNRSI